MMNQTAIVSLQLLCQLNCLRAPYSNDANNVVSDPPAISNQSPPPVQPATLPDGYIAYPEIGAAYKIVFEPTTWSNARERCYMEGAHLAIIDSQKKVEHVKNTTYHTYYRTADYLYMHTGIYRIEDKWVSLSTVRTLSDLPWISGYPVASYTDCTAITVSKGSILQGLWNLSDCTTKYAYICEIPVSKDYKTQPEGYQMAQIPVN